MAEIETGGYPTGGSTDVQYVTDHLRQRVGTVERNLDALREQNSQTQAQLSGLRTESHGHTRDLHDIKEALSKHTGNSATDWKLVGMYLGLSVVILTLLFTPVYRDLLKIEEHVHQNDTTRLEQAYRNGRDDAMIGDLKREVEEWRRSDTN